MIRGGLNQPIGQSSYYPLDVAAPALHSDNRFMKRWSRNRRHKNHSTAEVISQRQRLQSSNHTHPRDKLSEKSKTPYQSSKSSCPTCTPQTIAQAFEVIDNLYLFAYGTGVSGHGRLFVKVRSWTRGTRSIYRVDGWLRGQPYLKSVLMPRLSVNSVLGFRAGFECCPIDVVQSTAGGDCRRSRRVKYLGGLCVRSIAR